VPARIDPSGLTWSIPDIPGRLPVGAARTLILSSQLEQRGTPEIG
jgi:hypothetical protein